MVCSSTKLTSKSSVAGIGWVGDEETRFGCEPYWERLQDMIGGLAEERAELRLVRCVEKEMTEAVIRVHQRDNRG